MLQQLLLGSLRIGDFHLYMGQDHLNLLAPVFVYAVEESVLNKRPVSSRAVLTAAICLLCVLGPSAGHTWLCSLCAGKIPHSETEMVLPVSWQCGMQEQH